MTFSADALKLQLKTKEVFQTLILFLLVNFLGRHSLMAGLMILIQFFGEKKAISPIF